MDSRLIERVYRRVQMLFDRGRVTLVNDTGPVQTMQLKMSDMETCDNRLRMAEFGFTSYPPVGSDAVVAHIAGDRGSGVVVATNHQPSRPTGLQSGESMLYTEDGKQVYMTADGGIVVEAKGQNVVVNDAADVTWNCSGDFTLNVGGKFNVVAPGGTTYTTPTIKSSGDIQDNASTNSHTMAQMRTIHNTHTHPVASIQTGGSTINSNPPNQTE
jgi:phage baseplate assembly protein V